jgi:hypothetical protein
MHFVDEDPRPMLLSSRLRARDIVIRAALAVAIVVAPLVWLLAVWVKPAVEGNGG